ncbi:hypothetical protein QJS04_geneDACA023713 [Acorus gramineus]|uniref:Retrotransposon gag domain-containing protein n=1 Tax=Acorus gramineus TaxID=55184 RepID=A0AAV9A292_ACOGR|nr:hypothetical protein QJS04_geneDACA023713 [Acorus gramineus]
MVMAYLINSLSESGVTQVATCKTSAEVWHTLEVLYGTLTRSRIQQVNSELLSLSKGSLSVSKYIHRAKALAQTLASAGKPIDDDDLVMWILRGLGSELHMCNQI